ALWNAVGRNVYLTESALMLRRVLETEPLVARARLVADYAAFTGRSDALSRSLSSVSQSRSAIEHLSWERVRRAQARTLLILPQPGGATTTPAAFAEAAGGAPAPVELAPSVAVGTPPTVTPLSPSRVRTFTLPNGLEVITVLRPGIPV